MIMIMVFIMLSVVSSIIMVLALSIKAYKADMNEVIPRNEMMFVGSMIIGCFIPGLNLIASICYLYKVIKK